MWGASISVEVGSTLLCFVMLQDKTKVTLQSRALPAELGVGKQTDGGGEKGKRRKNGRKRRERRKKEGKKGKYLSVPHT